ncbi:hypothetical protein R6Q57_016531 [Mikania cordata]
MNWEYNFSKFILNEMKGNFKRSKGERFMMYPRFLQMEFDDQYPTLQRGIVTRDLKLLNESKFPLMLKNRVGKYQFQGLHQLRKFEEHDMEAVSLKNFDENVYIVKLPEHEDILTEESHDVVFDFETEAHEIEKEVPDQMDLLTTENLDALREYVKQNVGNPPSTPSFTEQEPLLDVNAEKEEDETQGLELLFLRCRMEFMTIKDKVDHEAREAMKDKPTRFAVDVEDSRNNYEGDRSGILCWGYDEFK